MEKIILDEKSWRHKLCKQGEHYVLSVPCGGAALYELDIPVDQATAEAGLHDPALLELLATSVQQDPAAYVAIHRSH
jgi:hypothetical protein